MKSFLLADGGGTKTTWLLYDGKKEYTITTAGIAPYLITQEELEKIVASVWKKCTAIKMPDNIFYYGTGCANPANALKVKQAIKKHFKDAKILVDHDLHASARAACQHEKGIACILGTGSNSGVYNGKKIINNIPGTGYILGDEGSGAYLGKLVIQYFLYNMFDEELQFIFNKKYQTNRDEIYENVYRKPLANKYLANYTHFLFENKGHYMIDNIIEDGLNSFFYLHLQKYNEVWKYPIHFSGGVAFAFKDYLKTLCLNYGFTMGKVIKSPIKGLAEYYKTL
jgi:glucosamine kinase